MKNTLLTLGAMAVSAGLMQHASAETPKMVEMKRGGFDCKVLHTVGEAVPSYTSFNINGNESSYVPPGVLDGMGAYEVNPWTVRVFVNHELLNFDGYSYNVSDGMGGTFPLTGARVSFFDIDKKTCKIKAGGLAYHTIYDATGAVASDDSFLANDFSGFSRFCSASLFEPLEWGDRGLVDRIFFTGEEDGGFFNGVGGAEWALDPATGEFWQLPDLGRGAWENVTVLDTGSTETVAILLADDTSPFDFNPGAMDGDEAAPLFLYVGAKDTAPMADFPARNGLRGGKLFVWVSDTGEVLPSEFLAAGSFLAGKFVELDTTGGTPSEDGNTGFDEFGNPTQGTLWIRARALGAFGFSRPEDVATNPRNGAEAVLASTGVDTYDIIPATLDGADTFGTVYKVGVNFNGVDATALPGTTEFPCVVSIIYDGDADPARALRSPDNLDWADDGMIYVQEDKAEDDTAGTAEPLFGPGAINECEAQMVRLDPNTGSVTPIFQVDRSVVLDPSSIGDAVDNDAADAGEWETSGIVDVSTLFDGLPGSVFLFDVQAHGIDDQDNFYPDSRITDGDLKEGGQLIVLTKKTALEAALENRLSSIQRKIRQARRIDNAKKKKRKIKRFRRQQNSISNSLGTMF